MDNWTRRYDVMTADLHVRVSWRTEHTRKMVAGKESRALFSYCPEIKDQRKISNKNKRCQVLAFKSNFSCVLNKSAVEDPGNELSL